MTAAIPDRFDDDIPDSPLGGPLDLQRAWQKMAGGAPKVVDVLMHIALHSEQDSVRVQASLGLLKMGGFGSATEVNVRVVPQEFDQAAGAGDGKEPVGKRLEARWALLREADQPSSEPDDDGIIDAVIVEDDSA